MKRRTFSIVEWELTYPNIWFASREESATAVIKNIWWVKRSLKTGSPEVFT
jgi:hypothetical protein